MYFLTEAPNKSYLIDSSGVGGAHCVGVGQADGRTVKIYPPERERGDTMTRLL